MAIKHKSTDQFLKFWLPVYTYAALIFVFSSFSPDLQPPVILHADKLLHLIEYAILGYLLARAAKNSSSLKLSAHFRVFAVCVAIIYGMSDEFHQYFVPGRGVESLDLVADGVGAFIGQLFLRG
ncbi:MAG: VanZ family protein [Candidatus Omnitrophica bacterium]|nr:VanZ family protein [Candidatus Omnitrophota bacterium]